MSSNAVSQKTHGEIDQPGGIVVPSSLVADYPACVAWFKMQEGSGASGTFLQDYIGNVTDLDVNYTGTGNPWSQGANPGDPIHSDRTTNNYNYMRTNGQAPSALRSIGAKSIILELDCQFLNNTDSDEAISIGVPASPSTMGVSIFWNGAANQLQYRVGGSGAPGVIVSFTPLVSLNGSRRHFVITHDRTQEDTKGVVSLYIDGVLSESKAVPTDPGGVNISSSGLLGLGLSSNGSLPDIVNAYYWNARIWYVNGALPANMVQIVSQMASMRNEFPPLMAGIS